MYTIFREIGRLDKLNVAMVGDLASGRTVHSLAYLLGKYKGNKLYFISPPNLSMKEDIKKYLNRHNTKFTEGTDLNAILPKSDIIYMTRLQKERISPEDYEKAKGKYLINEDNLKLIRKDSRLLHPLPHVEEINLKIKTESNDPRVAYFRQAENGLYVRMALLNMLLNKKNN
jgi:aspartate carbamoyltransferase catalytic subunit